MRIRVHQTQKGRTITFTVSMIAGTGELEVIDFAYDAEGCGSVDKINAASYLRMVKDRSKPTSLLHTHTLSLSLSLSISAFMFTLELPGFW